MTFEQIVGVALGINTLITVFNAIYTIFSASGARALAATKEVAAKLDKDFEAALVASEKVSSKLDADIADRQKHRADAEARFQLVEQRVTMIERDLQHLPSKDNITEVKLEIANLQGSVGKLDTTIAGISRTVNLLDDYLRNQER